MVPGEPRSSLVSSSKRDGGEILESHVVQDLQRHDGVDHAGLLVAHAGAMGAVAVDAKGRCATVPGPNTVSTWAMTRMRPLPVP